MRVSNIANINSLNNGASSDELAALQLKFDDVFPKDYVLLLKDSNGFMLDNGISIYSTDDLFERNKTLEVQEYAPGYIAIGDDSGGLSIMVSLTTNEVFSVEQSSMDPDDMEKLANTVTDWLDTDCKL